MTSKLDESVPATPLVLVPATAVVPRVVSVVEREAIEATQRARRESVTRWKAISEVGGIDAWIKAELVTKGLSTEGLDPATLTGGERTQYKEKKKAEAQERRTLRKLAWHAYHATHVTHLGIGVHWEDAGASNVTSDKFDIEQRDARARANGLPEIANADELAKALGVDISKLRWWAFQREVDSGTHYRSWTIPKRDGTSRTITSPKRELKAAQRWILHNVLDRLPVHGAAHGFIAGRSIVTNSVIHAGGEAIVKIDIKDFFPTITWRRVKGLLRKAGFVEGVATLMALICTASPRQVAEFRGKTLHVATGVRVLPQGAPTSPAITNAICLKLDRRMSGLARALGLVYTRYADDLTFSWKAPIAGSPEKQAEAPKAPVGILLRASRAILRAEGFHLNVKKTAVMRPGNTQRVTGLVVNGAKGASAEARVPRDVMRRLRAAVHNREKGKPGKEGESLAQLKGLAAFVHMADAARGRNFLDRIAALEAREKSVDAPV